MSQAVKDFWTSSNVGKVYAGSINMSITALPAVRMLEMSGVAAKGQSRPTILDNACGTGIVTELLFEKLPKDAFELTATDLGPSMVEAVKEKIAKNGWMENAQALVADMQDMSALKNDHYTHVFTNFGINMPPNAEKALSELRRVLAPQGINAFTSWRVVGWIPYVQAAFRKIPNAKPFPSQEEGFKMLTGENLWHDDAWIRQALIKAGYGDITIEDFKTDHRVPKEEFLRVWGGPMMKGMMGMFGYSKEEVAEFGDKILPALREVVEEKGDEEVLVPMYAWVVCARKSA